jgi:hypothetical protein
LSTRKNASRMTIHRDRDRSALRYCHRFIFRPIDRTQPLLALVVETSLRGNPIGRGVFSPDSNRSERSAFSCFPRPDLLSRKRKPVGVAAVHRRLRLVASFSHQTHTVVTVADSLFCQTKNFRHPNFIARVGDRQPGDAAAHTAADDNHPLRSGNVRSAASSC